MDEMMPPPMGGPPAPVDPMLAMMPPMPPAEPDVLPMSEEEIGEWKDEIKRSCEERSPHEKWWDDAVTNYGPKPTDNSEKGKMSARTMSVMVIVEVKNATLFHKRGEVSVAPSPLLVGQEALAKIHANILNEKLSVDGVDARNVMQQSIFDYEMFGGGYSLVVYEAFTRIDPMSGTPVPLAKKCSWVNLSPKEVLIPAGMKSPDFDRHAPWMGHKWEMPLAQAKRMWKERIPEDFKGSGRDSELRIMTGSAKEDSTKKKRVTGSTLWYRSHLYREEIAHPDHLTKLVLIDGIPEPVEHRDDPDQELTDQGALTPDSRIGFPICSLQIRKMTDSSRVMSDVACAMPLSTELDVYREQQIRLRALQLIRFAYNAEKMTKEALVGFFQDVMGGMIPFTDEMMQDFDRTFRQIDPGTYSQDNYRGAADIRADLDKLFGIDSNAAGVVQQGGGTTATESNNVQGNRGVRTSYEQGIVNDFYINTVTKLSTIIQRYLDPDDVAPIVGKQNAEMWAKWSKIMPTRLSFILMPDSTLWNDTAAEAQQALNKYSQLRNDQNVDTISLLKQLAVKWHLDPSMIRQPPPPPEPKPEPPKATVSFKMEDFAVGYSPQAPVAIDLFQKISGLQIDPNAMMQALIAGQAKAQQEAEAEAMKAAGTDGFTEHPGAVQPVDTLDKHQSEITGGMNGTGAPTGGVSPNMGQPAGEPTGQPSPPM